MAEIIEKEIQEIIKNEIKEAYTNIYKQAVKEIFSLVFKELDGAMLIGPGEEKLENYDVIKTDIEVHLIELKDKLLEELTNKCSLKS